MFCINCGKEIGEGIKFCPQCGVPVCTDADQGREEKIVPIQPMPGGKGDYETLEKMAEKAAKSKKILNAIAAVLMAVYAFFIVRGLWMNLNSVMEGRTDIKEYVLMVIAVILFTCAVMHIVLTIVFPILQMRKAVHAEEYLKYIQVNDKTALMRALGQMKCFIIKRVYMDEHGEVCVAGKKRKHTFIIQHGTLVMSSQKNDYKAVLERETIAVCLLKFLVPEAPVNAYANEKGNQWISRIKMLPAVTAIVCGVLFVIIVIVFGSKNKYIGMVKNGSPELYPNITYGEAFEAFFDNCEWKYFTSEDGKNVVEFHGSCMYAGDRVTMLVQFVVNETDGSFEVWTAAIDGEEQSMLVYSVLLMSIFESYGGGQTGQLDAMPDENDSAMHIENEGSAVDNKYADDFAEDIPWQTEFPTEDIPMDADMDEIVYPPEGDVGGGNSFVGKWSDPFGGWLYMEISYVDGIHYQVDISDRMSSSEFINWSFVCVYDADSDTLVYTDGQKWDIYQLEKTLVYDDGSGVFLHGEDGNILWIDEKEYCYGECVAFMGVG